MASEVLSRMGVPGVLPEALSEEQLVNVERIVDLLIAIRQRQPTTLSRRVASMFQDGEQLSNFLRKMFVHSGKGPILTVVQLVLWKIALKRDPGLKDKPNCQALMEFCSQNRTHKRRPRRPMDPQIAALIRRFLSPLPEWWTQEYDDIVDGIGGSDTRYARQPGGYRHTDEGWASYDATCRAAEAANPGFMDRFREHHEQAYINSDELAKPMSDAANQTAEIVQNRPEVCTAVEK